MLIVKPRRAAMARKTNDGDLRKGGVESITLATDGHSVTVMPEEFERALTNFTEESLRRKGGARRAADQDTPEDQDAPTSRLSPPAKVAFMGSEWIESEALKELAEELASKWRELQFLGDYNIRVLWKAEGGENKGRAILGKCNKPGGYARYFALCDWVIWLAADHCRQLEFTDEQIEALLYHELKHCVLVGKDAKPGVRGHDYEVFADELNRYGFWNQGRENLKRAVQGRMEFDEAHS